MKVEITEFNDNISLMGYMNKDVSIIRKGDDGVVGIILDGSLGLITNGSVDIIQCELTYEQIVVEGLIANKAYIFERVG